MRHNAMIWSTAKADKAADGRMSSTISMSDVSAAGLLTLAISGNASDARTAVGVARAAEKPVMVHAVLVKALSQRDIEAFAAGALVGAEVIWRHESRYRAPHEAPYPDKPGE